MEIAKAISGLAYAVLYFLVTAVCVGLLRILPPTPEAIAMVIVIWALLMLWVWHAQRKSERKIRAAGAPSRASKLVNSMR